MLYTESAERYVRLYADPRYVKVRMDSKRGPAEPFMVYPSKNSGIKSKYPFHLSYSQLNKLESGRGEVYGRTEWGPFCLLRINHYRVVQIKDIPFSDDDQEKIKKEVLEE